VQGAGQDRTPQRPLGKVSLQVGAEGTGRIYPVLDFCKENRTVTDNDFFYHAAAYVRDLCHFHKSGHGSVPPFPYLPTNPGPVYFIPRRTKMTSLMSGTECTG
jgi:hypothetical protein